MERKTDIHSHQSGWLRGTVFFLYAIILAFVACLSLSVYRIRSFDLAGYRARLEERLSKREVRLYPIRDTGYLDRNRLDRPGKEDVPVYVFGGSSVILASEEDKVFSVLLEEQLRKMNPDVRVFNFGVSAIDSFGVKRRVEQVFERTSEAPRLIVFYMGHNDYTNVYKKIFSDVYDRFGWILRLSYSLAHDGFDESEYFRYRRLKVPVIVKNLQYLRLIRIPDEIYSEINRVVLDAFKRNVEELCGVAKERKIPVIFMTPVGNLVAEPYGNIHTVTSRYKKGMDSGDYAESISELRGARDSEMLTADVRGKSPLCDYLRGLEKKDVHVVDLERELMARGSRFDGEVFTDYFHLTDGAHALLAGLLEGCIMKDEKLKRVLGICHDGK